jgi:outer membrane protein assembly factor BamE (lipoprotein component of BamABCDE complex)
MLYHTKMRNLYHWENGKCTILHRKVMTITRVQGCSFSIRYEHKTLTKNGKVVDARRMNDMPQGMSVQETFR